jgi:superfamily II DNA or RNA helicase
VKITDVEWHGNVLEVTYRTADGATDSQLVYRDDEEHLEIATTQLPWTFGADANQMRLVSEAYRISLAHLFDPYLAVHTSSVEPLPHQISAVYQDMLPKVPLRYILADDPGAGKTIMTGLYIKELIARGDLKRCLIVSPGNLVEQWQDELFSKFHLRFTILTNDQMEAAVTGNIFTEVNYAICRMDKLARDEDLKAKLKATEWDLIVVDEAHKMAATVFGNDVKYTKRFQLGRLLSEIARNYLLLTATPHNGKNEDFQLFLSLLDPDRFGLIHGKHGKEKKPDVSDVMRRLVKEELLKFDGTPLFPERRAYTVNYTLSPEEAELYQAVTHYVREEFNRADNLNKERKATVGFALTILQRRLASSPEAIYQSLRRRRERLEQRLTEVKAGKAMDEGRYGDWTDDMDEDDYLPEEMESREEQVLDHATAAATITELEAEIETLKNLEMMANRVRRSGKDRKWDELSKLLQDNAFMYGKDGQREKLIIFTEHKDTLNYLAAKIRSLLGDEKAVVTIHGGMARQDRRNVEALFKQDVNVRILIATDAAGEGINLQRAHLMINYDLPWNPNRLEQRFGRIHRIGQTEVCHLWNLVANETREGYVFQRLLSKLEEERKALGGRVFDILGKITFENKSLKDLLVEAIRYGNDPDVKARMNRIVDSSMDPEVFKKLMKERALTSDVMDTDMVMGIKEDMERMEAHKLQPHFIEAFFLEAFREIGGQVTKREKGRYQITRVPYVLRQQQRQAGYGAPVLPSYERICFDKEDVSIPGKPEADLVCPGHPLLEAVISVVKERDGNLLKEGTIFINDNDDSQDARLLFYIEDAVRDGVELAPHVYRVISKHIHFVEMKEDGTASSAGYAPYLDYRAPTEEEKGAVKKWMKVEDWITQNPEKKAKDYAIEYLIPAHFEEVKKRKCAILDKTEREVRERLTEEIQYWDGKAAELEEKERAGKPNAHLNSQMASRRADELEQRRKERLKEIEKERNLKRNPPVITGGALVIPKGLLNALLGSKKPDTFSQGDRKSMEMAAMEEVMAIERSFGYLPKDVSLDKVGYDIESTIPPSLRKEGEPALRFIEVKGRQMGATTVTVSKNEILTALNKPEEFILAVVEVDGEKKHTVYMKHPFTASPDFSSASVNYDLQKLKENADILYEK